MTDKALVKQKSKDVQDRIYEEGDIADFEQKPVKDKVFVESFRDKYWNTSGVFLERNKTIFSRELRDLLSKMQRGEDTTGLQGIYEAITNSKTGRQWIDDYFSIGNAATQTRIVCGMPDGFSQTGKSVNLSSSNTQQDWNGYGKIKGKGNVKLDLEPFSYDNFINCRKRQCWLCGMPLYWDKTMFPEGEHILQYPMMTCFGAGPVTKLFLVEEREKGGIKQLDERSNLSGFYSTVSSLIGVSRTDQFIDWKRRVRTFSYAWSHSHCNRVKCDKSFIKIGMRNNGDIYYYINHKAVNWFVNSIVNSITNKTPLIGGRVGQGWMQVLDGLKKSKKAQGGKVQKKANAIGFKSIYENIMKQLIPLNHLLNEGFGDIGSGPRKINLNNRQNKIRANIYFNYRRLKVYFDEHMSEFYSAETNKEKKSLANKTLLMNFFGSILKKKPKHLKKQRALLNHCFNYENDNSVGSSRGGGKKDKEEFNSTYSYLPLAELLNDMTGYSKPGGVKYINDLPTESGKDFDDSMNFGSLLEQIRPGDYDKEDGSIVQEIYNTYMNFEGEIKDYSESAMKNFISNMLMKMKFDKYGELLDYLSLFPSINRKLEEQESLKQILFNDKKNKKEFDEWFVANNMVNKIPYIYDIEGEVKKLVDANYISPEIANEKYYDYFKDNIVEINDGAQWQLWKVNLVKYLQHRTETGEVETFGDDSGETYMKKKPDFSQTYLNNLKIIQYKGLLPRIDNIISSRQKKLIQEKRMERDQKRYAKILENRKKGLPIREGIKFKEGDGLPENFSDPKYSKKGNIMGGPQIVRAQQKLNDAMYNTMSAKEQDAVRKLEGLQNISSTRKNRKTQSKNKTRKIKLPPPGSGSGKAAMNEEVLEELDERIKNNPIGFPNRNRPTEDSLKLFNHTNRVLDTKEYREQIRGTGNAVKDYTKNPKYNVLYHPGGDLPLPWNLPDNEVVKGQVPASLGRAFYDRPDNFLKARPRSNSLETYTNDSDDDDKDGDYVKPLPVDERPKGRFGSRVLPLPLFGKERREENRRRKEALKKRRSVFTTVKLKKTDKYYDSDYTDKTKIKVKKKNNRWTMVPQGRWTMDPADVAVDYPNVQGHLVGPPTEQHMKYFNRGSTNYLDSAWRLPGSMETYYDDNNKDGDFVKPLPVDKRPKKRRRSRNKTIKLKKKHKKSGGRRKKKKGKRKTRRKRKNKKTKRRRRK